SAQSLPRHTARAAANSLLSSTSLGSSIHSVRSSLSQYQQSAAYTSTPPNNTTRAICPLVRCTSDPHRHEDPDTLPVLVASGSDDDRFELVTHTNRNFLTDQCTELVE